jgi:hypothetical protein
MVLLTGRLWLTARYRLEGRRGDHRCVAGLIGAITEYFAANARTVVDFLYGGSLGERKNADSLASATVQLGASLGKVATTL